MKHNWQEEENLMTQKSTLVLNILEADKWSYRLKSQYDP